jgi:hypothetical protein
MQYDFRSVYASILERWFCLETQNVSEIMLQPFQSLPIIESAPCGFITSKNEPENEIHFKVYPNPVIDFAKFEFNSKGGLNVIQVFNAAGQMVSNPINKVYPVGIQIENYNASSLPKGVYYVRWENNAEQKIVRMLKS